MMPKGKRYFSEYSDETGVTPSRLKRLGKATQREYLLHWFGMYYEDPAQETPYNSQEGGYQYVWGGPYDAREELEEEFGSFISESVIESIVEEVESDGLTDWAPGRHHSDHQRAADEYYAEVNDQTEPKVDALNKAISDLESGITPNFGDAIDLEYRRIVGSDLDTILRALPSRALAGIGHNRPPLDNESSAQDAIEEIREAATSIKGELAKAVPDAIEAAQSASKLRKVADWIWKKFDTAADAFSKKIGEHAATATVVGATTVITLEWQDLGNLLKSAVGHASQWLAHITLPF